MSFSLTTPQMRARAKDVTRRAAWWNLTPGTLLRAVEKAMGLKAGEKVKRIGTIRVLAVRRERLDRMIDDEAYGLEEVKREGFEGMTPMAFVTGFCVSHRGCTPRSYVNRIAFEFVERPLTAAQMYRNRELHGHFGAGHS